MGCSASVHKQVTETEHRQKQGDDTRIKDILNTKTWKLLMEWCGWKARDQFGFEQPKVESILGVEYGRSILGGCERPHQYQVAVSFPGATFVKGELGSYSNLTDEDGNIIATNGAEMAEALRHWLVEDWLGGDEKRGLTHVFIDKCNLMYCEGSVLAEGFGKKDAKAAVAVLNENWAIYLREAFLEAKCVVFLINQDWMDSVPCNLEFEGLVKRKSTFRDEGEKQAVVFIDITRSTYSTPFLPQYLAALREAAGSCFDVHNFKFNEDMSPGEKRAVRVGLRDVVSHYCVKHDLPAGFDLKVRAEKRLNWSNWIYYGALEGSNGWREMVAVDNLDWEQLKERDPAAATDRLIVASFQVQDPFPSRRFRLRVTRLFDGMWGELQLIRMALYDRDTGQNIVGFGKGYIKARGELAGVHPASGVLENCDNKWVDKCGSRQYSWLEWLVPDDHPPVTIDKVTLAVDDGVQGHERPVDFVFEAMTVHAWPQHGNLVRKGYMMPREVEAKYDFFPWQEDAGAPKWVRLHGVQDAMLQPGRETAFELPEDRGALPCAAYRIRFQDVVGSSGAAQDVLLPGLALRIAYPEPDASDPTVDAADDVLFPVGGGLVTGSGGEEEMEDSGPDMAFTDHQESRWIDGAGGGLDGGAWWQYEHPEPVTVVEYALRSTINTMGYFDMLHGAPRDWVLKARAEGGGWVVLDTQSEVYFSDFRQLKRFRVSTPIASRTYRLEFSAVRCGCASKGLVVGDVYLMARRNTELQPPAVRLLAQHQAWLTPSAHVLEAPGSTVTWNNPTSVSLRIPLFPGVARGTNGTGISLHAVAGGVMRWLGATSQWYTAPVEFPLNPQAQGSAEANSGSGPPEGRGRGPGRTWAGTLTLCGRPYTRFRVLFPDGEITLGYSADRPLVLGAYSLASQSRYQRGDPRSWRLEAQDPEDVNAWHVIHAVDDFVYEKMCQALLFFLPSNTFKAREYRIIITRMHGPSPHIATTVGLYERTNESTGKDGGQGAADSSGDTISGSMRFEAAELASLEIGLRPREGKSMLQAYSLTAAEGLPAGTPKSWVVEGLTSRGF